MDLTEAFTSGGGGSGVSSVVVNEDLEKTDFFDFVVSPQPLSSAQPPQSAPTTHCTSIETISNEENILRQTPNCRGLDFLHDRQLSMEDHHDQRDLPFIKETNNNTLTALPPVSTITSSLSQHARNNNCDNVQSDQISMEHSDCDYWSAVGDNKEPACNILLEDLNKFCWSSHHTGCHHSLVRQSTDASIDMHQQVNDSVLTACSDNGRQNTDGAIYTLTVLNNETDSMDALDCCKSPVPTASDSWSLRPNLDLDAILNLEPTTGDQQQDHDRIGIDGPGNSPGFHTISTNHPTTHYSADEGTFVESKELCNRRSQSNSLGDNNNDWKLTDQNHLNEATVSAGAVAAVTSTDSAESLLRSALQGKLYTTGSSTPTLVSSSSSQANSTISLTASSTNATNTLQLITDHHHHHHHLHQPHQQQDHLEEEVINACSDEDLILSQLDTPTYRPVEYEKLKSIANEVVESYCSLEPVCNVSATTVMYTLDPSSGNLGTITLPADLGQVGTVTVVTASNLAAQQDMLQQAVSSRSDIADSIQQQVTSNQIGNTRVASSGSVNSSSTTKSGKKHCRRKTNSTSNSNNGNSNASSSSLLTSSNSINSSSGNSNNNSNTNQQQSGPSGGSPSSVQRKERSLHYCSICSKGFKDKYSVNVHIRTHTGEKPFACSLCGKSFRQKAHLAKHYQTHVAQKPNVANANNNTAGANTTSNNNNSSSNNNNNINNSNNNSNSAEISTVRAQSQLVTTVTATCNPTSN